MNTKTKATLAILATFIVGLILGAIGNGALMNSRSKKFDSMRPSEFLLSDIQRIVQPDSSQREAVDTISKRTAQKIEALLKKHRLEMTAILDSMRSDFALILTQEQRERLRDRLKSFERQRTERPGFGPPMFNSGFNPPQRLKEELNLDEVQTEQVHKIYEDAHVALMKTFEASRDNPQAMRTQASEMMAKMDEKIEALLTEKQKEKFQQIKKERPLFPEAQIPTAKNPDE
jgi:Spy/CpxP family protein refolding chaperone